jgi:hypothetical protein
VLYLARQVRSAAGVLEMVRLLMVVEAEMLQAERQIEAAGGRLLASILNKRKYLVPEWAQRRL